MSIEHKFCKDKENRIHVRTEDGVWCKDKAEMVPLEKGELQNTTRNCARCVRAFYAEQGIAFKD